MPCGYVLNFFAPFLLFSYLLSLVQPAAIAPLERVTEGDNLTITCITTNGGGAGVITLVNENGTAYSRLGNPVVDSTNFTVGRFNFGRVERSDNGRQFACDNTVGGGSVSMPIVLQVFCRPTMRAPQGPVSVPLTAMQVAELFRDSVGGCPGNIPAVCIGARRTLSFVSNNGSVLLNGLLGWSRADFGQGAFSVRLSCTASLDGFSSMPPVPLTVNGGALSCGERLSCWLVIVIICIAVLVAVCILLAVIICICVMCKKKKNPGNGSEELKEKELDEKL
jgi:hypothetical protein